MPKKSGVRPSSGVDQKQQKPRRHAGGMPAGHVTQKTIDKLEARAAVRQIILERMHDLVDAQVANAQGLKYLVTRDKKTGKFVRVGAAMAGDLEHESIEVWEKDPSVQAFTDLMNRALDKPAEQEQQVEHKGTIVLKHEL